MNKERRKNLSNAIEILEEARAKMEEAKELIEYCREEEEECYDNLPEGVQCSERGEHTRATRSMIVSVVGKALLTTSGLPLIRQDSGNSILTL